MRSPFVFPRALGRLDYPDRLRASDRKRVTVDVLEAVHSYCTTMNLGMAYQRFIYHPENLANPDRISRGNFQNARNVHSMGWSYAEHEDIFDRDWPQLHAIPQNADLLATAAFDEPAVELLVELSQRRGISISNATKLLHQKRPGLIPVLDDYARRSMDVYWIRGSGRHADAAAYRLGFERCREIVAFEENYEALSEAQAWLARDVSPYKDLPFTRLRLLDIVAWMQVSSPSCAPS